MTFKVSMRAMFPGKCPGGDEIKPGDEITKAGRGWAHRFHNPGVHPFFVRRAALGEDDGHFEDEGNAAERRMMDQEYAAGIEDANRERFNRQMFGESYAAAEEYARDMRGLNGDW